LRPSYSFLHGTQFLILVKYKTLLPSVYFGGFRCLHFQDNSGNSLVSAENGGKTLLRNDSSYIAIYTASYRRRLEILCTVC